MKTIETAGRLIFAVPFVLFGIQHFVFAGNMAALVPPYIPGGVFWVYLTGAVLILSAISIMTQKFVVPFALMLSAMLMGFVFMIQLPLLSSPDMMMRNIGTAGFLKDFALSGASLMVAGLYLRKSSLRASTARPVLTRKEEEAVV